MKKLIIAFLAISFGSFSIASAELGVNIGFSGQMGVFVADGSETEAGTLARSNTTTLVAYQSVFIEKTLGSRLTIGYDYVPTALSTDTAESTRCLTLNSRDKSRILKYPLILESKYIPGSIIDSLTPGCAAK